MKIYSDNIYLNEVCNKIMKYFTNWEEFSDIFISQVNDDFIRFCSSKNKVYLKLVWYKIFDLIFDDYEDDNETNFKRLNDILKDDYSVNNIFVEASREGLYYDISGRNIILWGQKINSYKNRWTQGYFSPKAKCGEFIIEENPSIVLDDYDEKLPECLLTNFYVGNASVSISEPSSIYKLLFKILNRYDIKEGWEYYLTLSIKDIRKSELNAYLQQAIFLLNLFNSNILLFGCNEIVRTYPNRYTYNEKTDCKRFPKSLYIAPISFFNEAINMQEETCFLYYYKVLEYFFIINQKEAIIDDINKYKKDDYKFSEMLTQIDKNQNGQLEKIENKIINIENKLIQNLNKIYSLREDICLVKLLENKDIKERVESVIKKYFYIDLMDDPEQKTIDADNISIEQFAKQLYLYRNRIVHGKDDYKYKTRVPNLLNDFKNNGIIETWDIIINRLALLCIKYFCYRDSEEIHFEI